MKIGLAGGVANSHYQIAKLLNQLGYNIFFAHEREENFAFSQPVWEEVSLTLSYEDTMTSHKWDRETWLKIERQSGWKVPEWIFDVYEASDGKGRFPEFIGVNNIFYWLLEKRKPSLKKMRIILSGADFLILGCGWPEIIGPFINIPYVIWPSGGDMREAAGLPITNSTSLLGKINQAVKKTFLKMSFENAQFVASHNPVGMGALMGCERLKLKGFEYFPFPLEPKPPIKPEEKRCLLKELASRLHLELPPSDIILFIPSRLDFFWKGLDKFLRAFTSSRPDRVGVICSGWGMNRSDSMRIVREADMGKKVKFLDVSLSKPLLLDMFRAVDLVVDQFNLGAYGTAALEAMSVGTPVMMWIDTPSFNTAGMSVPPILNAQTEDEISNLLHRMNNFEIDLTDKGRASLCWIEEVHHYKKVLPQFIEKISSPLRQR